MPRRDIVWLSVMLAIVAVTMRPIRSVALVPPVDWSKPLNIRGFELGMGNKQLANVALLQGLRCHNAGDVDLLFGPPRYDVDVTVVGNRVCKVQMETDTASESSFWLGQGSRTLLHGHETAATVIAVLGKPPHVITNPLPVPHVVTSWLWPISGGTLEVSLEGEAESQGACGR